MKSWTPSEFISLSLPSTVFNTQKELSKVGWRQLKETFYCFSFPDSLVGKESICNARDPSLIPVSGRSTGEGNRLPTPVFLGFPCGSAGKESACKAGDLGSLPGLEDPWRRERLHFSIWPGEFHGLYSPWDHKSGTWLRDFHFPLFGGKAVDLWTLRGCRGWCQRSMHVIFLPVTRCRFHGITS